jgi:transaldolase
MTRPFVFLDRGGSDQSGIGPQPGISARSDIRPQGSAATTLLNRLSVKIFADGADKAGMLGIYMKPYIKGLTTNPTLMRKAGIANYRAFAKDVLLEIIDKPVCFEVLADDFEEMERQALEIAGWADNVFVKIPVTNTKGESCGPLVKRLADRRVKLNVTAIMTLAQVREVMAALNCATASYVSVFAGRIADTGRDPVPMMAKAVEILKANANTELVWASSREIFNIFQADAIGCHVITVTEDILKKLSLLGYDLTEYSLDTVKMFYDDARGAGFSL